MLPKPAAVFVVFLAPLVLATGVHGRDCNANGTLDAVDIAQGSSRDCNNNSIPDDCEKTNRVHWGAFGARNTAGALRVEVAEIDGLHDPDIVWVTPSTVQIYFMKGRVEIAQVWLQIAAFTDQAFTIDDFAAADLDRDSDLDLAFVGRGLLVLWNDGSGRFPEYGLVAKPASGTLAAGDFDADGDFDLAYGGTLTIAGNRGNRVFLVGASYPRSGFTQAGQAADVDGDLNIDLVTLPVQPGPDDLRVYWNSGSNTFDDGTGHGARFGPRQYALGDLDGDDDLDVVFGNEGTETQGTLRNEGSKNLAVAESYAVANVRTVDLGDTNGDGRLDLIACSLFNMTPLLNVGGGTWLSLPPVEQAASRARDVALADFNHDGFLDMRTVGSDWGTMIVSQPSLVAADCNANGVLDECDLAVGTSVDADLDSIPDECEPTRFHRGDADGDGVLNLTDPITLLRFLFAAGPPIGCGEAGDADNSGTLDVTDAVLLLSYLFRDGPVPASPGPPTAMCGPDPDPRLSPGDIGCDRYEGCGIP